MRSTLTIFSWLHCLLGAAYCIERPQIMKLNGFIMDEARIQKVDNDILALSCFANYPVKWVLPDNSQYQNYSNPDLDGRLKTVFSNADRNNITIVISDLRWTDTGFYRCLAMDSTDIMLNPLMGESENRIYLYIKDSDPKHLFLHLNGDMIPFKRFETSYLNCLVTDISATVEISFETKIDDKLKYVNGFGFEVPPKALKQISFDYAECKANVNDNISSKVDSLSLIIVAHDPPVDTFSVTISPVNVEYLFYLNNTVTMTCNANSQYKKCQWETPRGRTISKDSNNELEITHINMNDSGIYKCSCHDTMYKSPDRAGFVQRMITVREKKERITVVGSDSNSSIAENSMKMFSASVKFLLPPDYTSNDVTVRWYRRYSILLNGYKNVEEEVKSSAIFWKVNPHLLPLNRCQQQNENPEVGIGLLIKNTAANLSGDYILSIRAMDEIVNYTFHLDVVSQNAKLNIFVTEASKTDKLNPKYLECGKNYDVWCLAEGLPKQNGTVMFRSCIDGDNNCENMEWIRVIDNTFYKEATFQSAVVARLSATKTGMYSCSLKSNISKENVVAMPFMVSDIQNVQENHGFGPGPKLVYWLCGLLGFFVLILFAMVVLQCLKYAEKLKKLQNIAFRSLSYPLQFEIPVRFILPLHRPKILLGSGEFGEVVLSFLHIPADNLAVAVKVIKSTLPVDQIIELLFEVKIMIYSGYHINVLPLIGAVTSCLGMNKLYVVTEFCKFGSLLDFVENRRDSFINELITLNNQLRTENEHFSIPNGYLIPVLPRSLPAYHRSHSKGIADSQDLCTSDLLYFSYQIANGMEFLSNKKIIHRDLALRNILVTENNLIRISDFGLSRHGKVYQIEKNKFQLPYLWMAYESLTDNNFSEKSDIWSFGIVLWEIFTLGEQPYHEYKNVNDFKNALKAGKRLHKPVYASDKMYNFMKRCWSLKSELRPTFTECKVILAEELNTFCVECHSKIEIILNDPKNQPDYSALQAKFVENSLQLNNGCEMPNSHFVAEDMINQSVEKIKNRYYQFPNTPDTEDGQPLIRNETKV